MSLLGNIFGKKILSEAELRARTEEFLRKAEKLLTTDLKAAMKLINKRDSALEKMLEFGAPDHERFASLVLKTAFLARSKTGSPGSELTAPQLPTVLAITDEMAGNFGQAMILVQDSVKELIYLRYDREYDGWQDARYELEAVLEFVYDPKTLLIYISPHHTFIKRETLLLLAGSLKPETGINEIPDQLTDLLEKQSGVIFEDNVRTALGSPLFKYTRG